MSLKKKLRQLDVTKNSLRDELWTLKSLVRKSFGSMSQELCDLQDTIVEGCVAIQEQAMLHRFLGVTSVGEEEQATAGASSERFSVAAVFRSIDRLHQAMEQAGVRRRRHHSVSVGGAAFGQDEDEFDARTSTDPTCSLSSPEPISAGYGGGEPQGAVNAVDVVISAGSDIQPWSLTNHCGSLASSNQAPANLNASIQPAGGSKLQPEPQITAAQLTRYRTAAFAEGNVYSVSPFALSQACQLRLDTLSCVRAEVLVGALQAQRKLVSAKRWIPDAPNPLAASVESLLCEVLAMKRLLVEESPSLSMATLPMAQFPLPSRNVKQMKQQLVQQQQRLSLSPRRSPRTPTRAVRGDALPPLAFLQAQRDGTVLVEGADAVEAHARKHSQQDALTKWRCKKAFGEDRTLSSQKRDPLSGTHTSVTDVDIIQSRVHTKSDDIQKILRAVKSEIQVLKDKANLSRGTVASRSQNSRSSAQTQSPQPVRDTRPVVPHSVGARASTSTGFSADERDS